MSVRPAWQQETRAIVPSPSTISAPLWSAANMMPARECARELRVHTLSHTQTRCPPTLAHTPQPHRLEVPGKGEDLVVLADSSLQSQQLNIPRAKEPLHARAWFPTVIYHRFIVLKCSNNGSKIEFYTLYPVRSFLKNERFTVPRVGRNTPGASVECAFTKKIHYSSSHLDHG